MFFQQVTILFLSLVLYLQASDALQKLPPRLSSPEKVLRVKEGQKGVVLECNLDLGDDPISYRWLKQMRFVTASLGSAYRSYKKVQLALHAIQRQHAGTYDCEASNDQGVDVVSITVIVEPGDFTQRFTKSEAPDTSLILSELATSLNDVLAEGNCNCDMMFLLHASPDAPSATLSAQANFVYTVAKTFVSPTLRVAALTYSDYVNPKLTFGQGTNECALRNALQDLSHDTWATRIGPVLRDAFKRFKKSSAESRVLFLQIYGSLGVEGTDIIEASLLKKLGVTIFILEVTPFPLPNVTEMASKRGDGKPYHWHLPLQVWPTIISYMNYMPEELLGCAQEDVPSTDNCRRPGESCTKHSECQGSGVGCVNGQCKSLQCNANPDDPGCCGVEGQFWCGDVTQNCTAATGICDGRIQCMNGEDESHCWEIAAPCDSAEVRCQSSTLCLAVQELCDGEPQCPGAEDEDPRFCRSFPCPEDRPFRCQNGKCINTEAVCDGILKDCDDGEDEDLSYCSQKHICPESCSFKCDYGICIQDHMVCDGVPQCLDAADERICLHKKCPSDRPFKCQDGKCVEETMVCNGVIDDACSDGSDEINCLNYTCPRDRNFKCFNGRCIDSWLVCNGKDECGDESDEVSCKPTAAAVTTAAPAEEVKCLDDQFYCSSGICLSASKVCDGRKNCLNGEDEDEELCRFYPCPEDRPYRCLDGACVQMKLCDNVPDCADGSDEENCTIELSTENNPHEHEDEDMFNKDDSETLLEDEGTFEALPEPPSAEQPVPKKDATRVEGVHSAASSKRNVSRSPKVAHSIQILLVCLLGILTLST